MGRWVPVIYKGRQFNQWQPTVPKEPMPDWCAWDGCPKCGAKPEGDLAGPKRLRLNHDKEIHDRWVAEHRRAFSEEPPVRDVIERMEIPVEQENLV